MLLMVRSILTRWSPNTVIKLACEPTAGTWTYVPLSLIIVLNSSIRSVSSQSSFLGRIAVSREMTSLLWASARLRDHLSKALLTLCTATFKSISRARCTPKNSPVIQTELDLPKAPCSPLCTLRPGCGPEPYCPTPPIPPPI